MNRKLLEIAARNDGHELPLAVGTVRAAGLVGVSPHTFKNYVRRGLVPVTRLGRRVVVKISDLEKLLETGAPSRNAK
jgi:hypothetical protein